MENNNLLGKVLNDLEELICARKENKKDSYTYNLLKKNISRVSQKVGEEAVEVVISSVECDKQAIIEESADLLYHLSVLWVKAEVSQKDIAKELINRRKKD